jgi:hypothetical protein
VYKSNKPTTVSATVVNQQQHGVSDEHQHQQQMSSVTNQVNTTLENVTPVMNTSSIDATTSSQPAELVDDLKNTVPPIKENGDTSTVNGDENDEVEDEDDEYKKIQKVS